MLEKRNSQISVSIAQSHAEIAEAMEFCNIQYENSYQTHWVVPPDVYLVARQNGHIVATGGLTFASNHETIASERYYQLSPAMSTFVAKHRATFAEFGRFASKKRIAAKAILHAAISYCANENIEFLFAWANPGIYAHTSEQLGVKFWPIDAALKLDAALSDCRWASRPVGFFHRPDAPTLHLGVIPFWENTNAVLASQCNKNDAVEFIKKPETAEKVMSC